MKIYVAHSRAFDFSQELYEPIKNSLIAKDHEFIFPHDGRSEPFSSKEFFQTGCDLILAEVSYPSTGLGIELGWGDMLKVPIVCLYQKDAQVSGSLKSVTDKFFEYSSADELVAQVAEAIRFV